MLDSVSIAYLPQNTPPVVRTILVSVQQQNLAKSTTATTAASSNTAYSITVTDTGDSSTAAGTPSLTLSRATGQQLSITWQADDPDGDRLLYSLYFRGDDETQWKLLRGDITENTYQLDGDVFADGRYFFRVTASDRLANTAESAREAELVSAPVVIDNTPPLVSASAAAAAMGAWSKSMWMPRTRARFCGGANIRWMRAHGFRWKPRMALPIPRASNSSFASPAFLQPSTW